MRILGIDCGSHVTGFGVIEAHGRERTLVGYGAIEAPARMGLANRLRKMGDGLDAVLEKYCPEEAAVEDVFARGNMRSALVLAHSRGVALLCMARQGIRVDSYTPAQVKSSVTGYGVAGKEQVRKMVQVLLGVSEVMEPLDASDALAVACTHANLRDADARGG